MWLRVSRRQQSRDAYLETLHGIGIDADADAQATDAIRLRTPLPVQQLPGF